MELLVYLWGNVILVIIEVILVLVSIAFLTLLERKILGYIQDRKGPNKLGFMGLVQPFSEVIKLFSKEMIFVMKSNYFIFYITPLMSMFFLLVIWLNYVFVTNIYFMNYSILFVILILSLNGYMVMMMGWSSNSLYSMIGAIRSVAQTMSYEVSFIMIMLVQMYLIEGYSLMDIYKWQINLGFIFMLYPLALIYFISMLAEMNRSPMDFIEGESELVSGFNIEYFSGSFALIFLVEYGMIIFMSYLMVIMYLCMGNYIVFMLIMVMIIMLIIWMRGILPRMRYDELMYLCWKIILPMVLSCLLFFMSVKIIFVLII